MAINSVPESEQIQSGLRLDNEARNESQSGRGHSEPPPHSLRQLAYLLPRSADELRLKRSGFHAHAQGSSAFSTGLADYAHSLLAGWYSHEACLPQAEQQTNETSRLARLFGSLEQRKAVVTTAFHPIVREQEDLPVIQADSQGIRLRGKQTFGADALQADELLVFIRERGEHAPTAALLVPVQSKGLALQPVGSGETASSPTGVQVIYEDVEVPCDRVLINNDSAYVSAILTHPLVRSLADYQWASRQLAAIELLAGTAFALAAQTGLSRELHIQGELGKLIQGIETLKALLHAAEIGAAPSPSGLLLPSFVPTLAARKAGGELYAKGVQVLQRIGATAFLDDPGNAATPAGTVDQERRKPTLLQLAWQLAGSSEAARSTLHEQHAFGDPLSQSQELYRHYPGHELRGRYHAFWQTIRQLGEHHYHFEEVRQ
ncbi:hypothetical protein EBB07_07560 [Paenibacillaceae bacterium]|nr:hypothetical protein EBB07_07560 [Paenibacillaceae bacterium]